MVGQEGPPALARGAGRPSAAIALDRALADDDPELEQFAADPLAAPGGVLARHPGDQRPRLGVEPRPAGAAARAPTPQQRPALTAPADDGLRLDQDEVAAPVAPEPPD